MTTLSTDQKDTLIATTQHWIAQANALHQLKLKSLPVRFDLTGRAWGVYMRHKNQRWFRFNPEICALAWEESLKETIPHEVAHYVVDSLNLKPTPKPHGKEWRTVMRSFGFTRASVTHQLDLSTLKIKRQRRHNYHCPCQQHQLSTTRHNRILKGTMKYRCVQCGHVLQSTAQP